MKNYKDNPNKIEIYDSTLRDGAQSEGISYSLQDKLNIAQALDCLGVTYIEAGNPGSNPKDMEFFKHIKKHPLKNAEIVAFGSTRKKGLLPKEDSNIQSLLEANTQTVAIFGKSCILQVEQVLKVEPTENLAMIADTVGFFKNHNKKVVFDAEHFFDGYRNDSEYAVKTIACAIEAGADMVCLCDTNGGSFPSEIQDVLKNIFVVFPGVDFAIHAHNDSGVAVAASIAAVEAGALQVQGTITGFGERCGNANLSVIIPNLQLKMGKCCIPEENMELLTSTVWHIAEISNVKLNRGMPYVGKNAFTHKAGMHVDGMLKSEGCYEHINPEMVGNSRRVVMSEFAGRSLIIEKIKKIAPEIGKDSNEASMLLERIKELESRGYAFEGAEGSFELLVMRFLGKYKDKFVLEKLNVISEQTLISGHKAASVIVKVNVGDKSEITAAEGDGPVNAIDKALRKALEAFFPEIGKMRLTDYKVRVLDSASATGAVVRVLIESTDGEDYWTTVGVSKDIIKASCKALLDSIDYKLMKG